MKTNKTLAQKLCLLDLVSLLSYTAALLAALCFLVLLPGCSLGEKVDREPVQTLECTRPASLSGLYPAGGSVVLISWADYESGRTTVQLVDAEADTVKREVTLDGVWIRSGRPWRMDLRCATGRRIVGSSWTMC